MSDTTPRITCPGKLDGQPALVERLNLGSDTVQEGILRALACRATVTRPDGTACRTPHIGLMELARILDVPVYAAQQAMQSLIRDRFLYVDGNAMQPLTYVVELRR
jgi:hypothetical protein